MTTPEYSQDELRALLSWQMENGIDCALLDQPATADRWQKAVLSADGFVKQMQKPAPASAPISSGISSAGTSSSGTSSSGTPAPPPASSPKMASPQNMTSPTHRDMPRAQNDPSRIDSLLDLQEALANFEGCALKRTATNLVFADGNQAARIMIIGEAPGRDEDRMGLPFVGEAGKMLDKMLATIGLDRSLVYITNILPWRPPGNRTPTSEETALLWPFLKRHIQLKNPDIILAVGGSSAKLLLDTNQGILKLRGKVVMRDFGLERALPVLPSLHPAYLLRSPAQKRLAFTDLLHLRQIYDKLLQG